MRYLNKLNEANVERIKSQELGRLLQIPSATVRKDFSCFGELGRSGYGYEVCYLIEVFSEMLDIRAEKKIALIGAGNLGRALIKNNFRRNDNLNIVCAFDDDPAVIGEKIDQITVQSMQELSNCVQEKHVCAAISTVPSKYAQGAVDSIVQAGITAILNFAPGRVKVPAHVNVQYIDLTTELQTLLYFDENYKPTESVNKKQKKSYI